MIRTRLLILNAVVLALVLTLVGSLIFFTNRSALYQSVDAELLRRGEFLSKNWTSLSKFIPSFAKPILRPDPAIDPRQFADIEFESFIARPKVHRIGETMNAEDATPWDERAMKRSLAGERLLLDSVVSGRRVRLLSMPLTSNGQVTGAAQFAASLQNADAAVAMLAKTLSVLLPLSVLVMFLVGATLTRRALRPVGQIAEAADRIEASNLSGRLDIHGNDEFAHLAKVFNAMLDRLEAAFHRLEESVESQRRFVADASHELKTPLTAIKMRLGVAKRQITSVEKHPDNLASIERSANAMSAIVTDLLQLARSDEAVHQNEIERLEIDSAVEEAVAVVQDATGRNVSINVDEGIAVMGVQSSLCRAMINLLENAVRHTSQDKSVRLEASKVGESIFIRIVDEGCGIPSEDLPYVFDRFYRVSQARDRDSGGLGLGLAIVQSIIHAHGGSVSIESKAGSGTIVTIVLPAA